MQAGDFPLHIAVALQRSAHIDFVLLHVTGDFQLRHRHLPAAAVQAALGLNQTVELRRPVRDLFSGVDTVKRQFAAPADRLLPVEQRLQFGFPFEGGDGELIEIHLLLVALRVQVNLRWRQRLPFHRGAKGQGVVGHLAVKFQQKIVSLIRFLAGKRPVELLAFHLHIQRQAGLRQLRFGAQRHRDWTIQIDADRELFTHFAAHF